MLFTVASLFCAGAWSLPSLLTARVLQGLGAGGIMEREHGVGSLRLPRALAGPGFRTQRDGRRDRLHARPDDRLRHLSIGAWSWLFAINMPFGVVAILIGLKTLPRTPRATHGFDFPGAMMAAGCLGLFILGIGSAAHHERPGLISIELASAVLLGWALIRRQADLPAPVLPIDLFRRPIFALSIAISRSARLRSKAWLCLPAILLRGRSWPLAGRDRLFHDPMASCRGHYGADRRPSIRPPFRGNSRRPWSRVAEPGNGPAGDTPGQPACRRHRLAHGHLRMWVWFFSGAEHEGLDVQRACRS